MFIWWNIIKYRHQNSILTADIPFRELISIGIIGYQMSKNQEKSLSTTAIVISCVVALGLIILGIYAAYTDNHILLITFAGLMLASVVAGVMVEWFTLAQSAVDIIVSILSTIQFTLIVTNNYWDSYWKIMKIKFHLDNSKFFTILLLLDTWYKQRFFSLAHRFGISTNPLCELLPVWWLKCFMTICHLIFLQVVLLW